MRKIHLDHEVRVRFPQRSADFDDGVEVGMLAALMTHGDPVITRWVSDRCVEQLQSLARRLSYRVASEPSPEAGLCKVTLTSSAIRPKLRVVS